jgi:hypothetical protein
VEREDESLQPVRGLGAEDERMEPVHATQKFSKQKRA